MSRLPRPAMLLVVFVVVLSAYVLSPISTPFDSMFSIHMSMSLIAEGDTDLDEYGPVLAKQGYYNITEQGGHRYVRYPIGPSILAVPFVGAADLYYRVVHGHSFQKYLEQEIPRTFEKFVASVFVALTAVLIYLIVERRLETVAQRLVIVFVFAFCTSAWSTASRALWQHGPSMLMLSATLYLIVRADKRPELVQFAGLPLAFSYLVRRANALPIIVLSLLVLLRHRRYFPRFIGWAMVVIVPFVVVCLKRYAFPLPPQQMPWTLELTPHYFEALAGHLFSPSRGLLVFSPVLLFSFIGCALRVKRKRMEPLDMSLLAILAFHWLLISSRPFWWGGHSFGPRYFCDMIPFLMWFLVPVVGEFHRPLNRRSVLLVSTFVCLAAFSFFVHLRGATCLGPWRWNAEPVNVDRHPERLWDWSDPQFLR